MPDFIHANVYKNSFHDDALVASSMLLEKMAKVFWKVFDGQPSSSWVQKAERIENLCGRQEHQLQKHMEPPPECERD